MTTTTGWYVTGPAGSLYVDDGGPSGPQLPVVLVHSFGGSTVQWAPQLEHLRGERRAAALDLRAHGRSAVPPDADYTIESLAADVGAAIEGLGFQAVVLVGHGLGAKAAIEYAGAAPDRVRGLVLAAAPGRIPEAQARQMIAGLRLDYERVSEAINARLLAGATDDVRALVTREFSRIPRDAALSVIEASLLHDPVPALERYRGPRLAITTPDADTPNDIHRLVPDVPHVMMTDTSHWMQLDQPDAFNRILDRFLGEVGAP